jgi:Ca2+/H+ antiporter, TMEM165/GDT1 family
VAFLLTLAAALVAVGVELLEALAIVLAVGVTRRFRDALLGAAAAAAALALVALALGPLLLAHLPLDVLRVAVGALLLLFGLEWLRKGVLRLAGQRSRSSAFREFAEQRERIEELPLPPDHEADWAGRAIAFKGVLLEGLEVVLIVAALGGRPGGLAPALVGAAIALAAVVAVGAVLRVPLSRLPETQLKYGVGVVLSSFGVFFAAEGLGVEWPLGDTALLYVVAAFLLVSQAHAALLAHLSHRAVRA